MSSSKRWLLWLILCLICGSLMPQGLSPGSTPVAAQETKRYYFPVFQHKTQPITSNSYYMITIQSSFAYQLGCAAGNQHAETPGSQDSISVLDFSYPVDFGNGTYGAELFGFGPVPLASIETAVKNMMLGYYQCTGSDRQSNLIIGVGTNNKPTSTNTLAKMRAHGIAWANMVNRINQWAKDQHIFHQVQAFGASDIELGWNSPAMSRAWVDGYASTGHYPYIHFGDAAGCPYAERPYLDCGTGTFADWTSEDVWYVAYGNPAAMTTPLIYLTSGVHAQQWAFLSAYSVMAHGSPLLISGVFTQAQACAQWGCAGTDNLPEEAFEQLYTELHKNPQTAQEIRWKTDIRWILRSEAYITAPAAEPAKDESWNHPIERQVVELENRLASAQQPATTPNELQQKLNLWQSIAAAIAASEGDPAPKVVTFGSQFDETVPGIFQEGIREDGAIASLPYGASITSIWQRYDADGYLQIGAGTTPEDPTRGALYLQRVSPAWQLVETQLIKAHPHSGALKILSADNDQLQLEAEDGTRLIFSLTTCMFSDI